MVKSLGEAASRADVMSSEAHRRFWQTRLRRCRAIAAASAARGPGAVQPGLFDRRAEQEAAAATLNVARRGDDLDQRMAAAIRAAEISQAAPRLVLVLEP
jgi:hypothetical protein